MSRFPAKKFFKRFLKAFTPILSIILLLSNSQTVAAEFLKVTAPAEIFQGTAFEIDLQISAQENTYYFVKARIGVEEKQLTKAQTLDKNTNVWLSDSVAWDRFPKIQTNQDGFWSGKITVKSSSTSVLGDNLLVVRIKNEGNGSLTDSQTYSIKNIASQTDPLPQVQSAIDETGLPTLNEFMPQPADGKEWVEIKNKGNTNADISGWKIDDEPGKSSPATIPVGTIVPPGGFFVLYFSSAKLNDLADSVRLLKPDDSLVEAHSYTEPVKGQSFAKDSNENWLKTETPTPNSQNIITLANQQIQTSESNSPNSSNQVTENGAATVIGANTNGIPSLEGEGDSVASVSANFLKKTPTNLSYQLPFLLGGIVLIFSAFGFLFKDKLVLALTKFRTRNLVN